MACIKGDYDHSSTHRSLLVTRENLQICECDSGIRITVPPNHGLSMGLGTPQARLSLLEFGGTLAWRAVAQIACHSQSFLLREAH